MFNLKAEFYLKIIFLFSFIALISAFFIEYILGHQPCNLCLIERIPYGLSIMIIMAIFLIRKNQKFLVMLLILTFIFSFAISFYHYGIEQGFFKETSICSAKDLTESIKYVNDRKEKFELLSNDIEKVKKYVMNSI